MSVPVRGSDVFLKEDVRAIIAAILIANRHAPAPVSIVTDYDRGFATAMMAITVALGIDPSEIAPGR